MNNRHYKKSYDNDLYCNKPYDNELYYNKHQNKPTLTHNELIETNVLFDPPKKDAVIDILDVTNKVNLYCTTVKYNDFVRVKGYIYKTITYTTTKQEHLDRMNKYHEENMKDDKEGEIIAQNGADCGCNAHSPYDNYYPHNCGCKKHNDDNCYCNNSYDYDDFDFNYTNNDDCHTHDNINCNHKCDCDKCNKLYRGSKNNEQSNNHQSFNEYDQNDDIYWDYNNLNDDKYWNYNNLNNPRYDNFEDQYSNYDSYDATLDSDENDAINNAAQNTQDSNSKNINSDNAQDNDAKNDNRKDKDSKGDKGKGCKRDPRDPKNGYIAIDGVIRHTTAVIPFDVVLHMEGARYRDSINCELSFLRNSEGSCVIVEENKTIGLKETDVVHMNISLC